MSDKANESPPEEANEKVFGNGAVNQNDIKANPSLMPETYDKGKYTSEDDKDSEDTPMPSVDENKNPPIMENQENDIEAPTQTFAGNSPPGSPSSKRMRTSDSDQETLSPQSEEKDLGNSSQGVDAKSFYGPSTSNNFGPEPKRRSMENPVDRFDEVGPPKHRKLDRDSNLDSKPPGLLNYVPSAVRRSLAAITGFGPTENEFQSSNRMTRAQTTRKEREKELIHNIVTFCPTETVSTAEEVKIFFHAVLTPNFHFDVGKDKLVILMGHPIDKFIIPQVLMKYEKELENRYILFHGIWHIDKNLRNHKIPYKYVIFKGGSIAIEWEALPQQLYFPGNVNRCLKIQNDDENIMHKFDDAVRKVDIGLVESRRISFFTFLMWNWTENGGKDLMTFYQMTKEIKMAFWEDTKAHGLLNDGTKKEFHRRPILYYKPNDVWKTYLEAFGNDFMKSEFHPVIRIKLVLYIIFITKQRYFDADLRIIETFEVYLKTNEFEVNDFLFSNIDQEERLLFAKFIEDFVQKFLGHDKANCNFKDFWKWIFAMPFILKLRQDENYVGWMSNVKIPEVPVDEVKKILDKIPSLGNCLIKVYSFETLERMIAKEDPIIHKLSLSCLLSKMTREIPNDFRNIDSLVDGLRALVLVNFNKYNDDGWNDILVDIGKNMSNMLQISSYYMKMFNIIFSIAKSGIKVTEKSLRVMTIAASAIIYHNQHAIFNIDTNTPKFMALILHEFKDLDEEFHNKMWEIFKKSLNETSFEKCLWTYMECGENFPQIANDEMLQKLRSLMNNKNPSILQKLGQKLKSFIGNDIQRKHLINFLSSAIQGNVKKMDFSLEEVIETYTSGFNFGCLLFLVPEIINELDELIQQKLTILTDHLQKFHEKLISGDLQVKTILLFESDERMSRLKNLDYNHNIFEDINELVAIRLEEVKLVEVVEGDLFKFSQHMQIYVSDMPTSKKEIRRLRLTEVCQPRSLIARKQNVARISPVNDEKLEIIQCYIKNFETSRVFQNLAASKLKEMFGASEYLELFDIYECIGPASDVIKESRDFVQKLFSSEILVSDVLNNFQKYYESNSIHHEVRKLASLNDISDEKLVNVNAQVLQLFKIKQIRECAAIVLELNDVLGAKVPIKSLERINSTQTLQDLPLSKAITKDVLTAGKKFDQWEKDCMNGLKALTKTKKLNIWLKENINSTQQLKNFVELASISAGESDEEVDRVLMFQAAVQGYAPLLLERSSRNTLQDFIDACFAVLKNVKQDSTLPEKLRDSNRLLEWIKAIKDRHGSVEESSLTTVSQINQSGVYTISKDPLRLKFKHLENDEKDENMANRNFKKDEVQELRSKLMLITTGTDGKKNVDRYLKVFSLVEVLDKHLHDLIQAGCSLFAKFVATVYCDQMRKVSVIVSFGDEGTTLIHGDHELERNLGQIATFLKEALEAWKYFMKSLRDRYPSLNFFTTDQLIHLSQDLAKINQDKTTTMSSATLMMLRHIAPNVSSDKELVRFVTEHLRAYLNDEDTVMEDLECDDNMDADDDDDDDPLMELKEFEAYKEAKKHYLPNVALAAAIVHYEQLLEKDTEDLLIDWCDEHEDDLNTGAIIEKFKVQQKKKRISMIETPQENLNASNLRNMVDIFSFDYEDLDMKNKLHEIWKNYLEFVNQLKITDFLNFTIIAKILQEISVKYESKPNRAMVKTFAEGKPNLIVVPQKEIHSMCLMVYANDPEKPMPSIDEVFICSASTSLEQLELILLRAFHDKTGKIYSIINAENIDYDESVRLEAMLQEECVTNANYRLLFFACKEFSDRSYITTALDKHRRPMPEIVSEDKLQKYVLNHLSKLNQNADPDKCGSRIIVSELAGNGKSLVVSNLTQSMRKIVTQIHTRDIDYSNLVERLINLEEKSRESKNKPLAFHFDFSTQATKSKEDLIFEILILRGFSHPKRLWKCQKTDYYLLEITSLKEKVTQKKKPILIINILPKIQCISPREALHQLSENGQDKHDLIPGKQPGFYMMGFDSIQFKRNQFQRPYTHLAKHLEGTEAQRDNMEQCLATILNHCCVKIPSWSEISNFTNFLSVMLKKVVQSYFANSPEDFPGFKAFLTKFLIIMAKDFATRSIEISDESQGQGYSKPEIEDRRRWENSTHPYVFFNEDGQTFSFHGFILDPRNLNILNEKTGEVLHEKIISQPLFQALKANEDKARPIFNRKFDAQSRVEKLEDLCMVFGILWVMDVDPSYELTSDNVQKMFAIWTRFQCNIPVIIMGETGCGKTRLIRFMCDLLRQNRQEDNMMILKMHGGITDEDIFHTVNNAIKKAERNTYLGINTTVLFFDEANTTDSISTVKTIMCDRLVNGNVIPDNIGLQFVAAVNPYREHSEEMVSKLEKAGLGYHIKAENTRDQIGRIPLRRLVYRVREIPSSLFPLIWDFGTLNDESEKKYILQMVQKSVIGQKYPTQSAFIVDVLNQSQNFMRSRQDECSFVSLRDVERALVVFTWFSNQVEILEQVNLRLNMNKKEEQQSNFTLSIVLALGVTYYARLERRNQYVETVSKKLQIQPGTFEAIIKSCQGVFIDEMKLENTIAKNDALNENVWMMAICIELRIPLFLVGKPGSSKSLAKTIVTDVMQGPNSYSELFKKLKEIHMVSFQCSPLATAGGILSTFKQCQKYQEKRDLDGFTSVCILDEIGLAEDSEKMPLKALHPLLEDGTVGDEEYHPWKKVAFVGISNWALDPAKMNRGILLSRGVPTEEDLVKSADGICSSDEDIKRLVMPHFKPLAHGYYHVYNKQKREFFGLRDFYSLVKMLYALVVQTGKMVTEAELMQIVQRNFGGYFGEHFKPAVEFLTSINRHFDEKNLIPNKELILKSLERPDRPTETRYLLLLTKNNIALRIIEDHNLLGDTNYSVIYGSSFPHDQEYTQICYNINRIKIAMETGMTVVLMNLGSLYESLYDALNQNYMELGCQRYVDLGLGTHRVKCRVHPNFRLILIAKDEEVWNQFSIPLINRLEKHCLFMETMLRPEDLQMVSQLKVWAKRFSEVKIQMHQKMKQFVPEDVFIGYHEDSLASIILKLTQEYNSEEKILEMAKIKLLHCAAPDAIARLSETCLIAKEQEYFCDKYYENHYTTLGHAIRMSMNQSEDIPMLLITTQSRLLTKEGNDFLIQELDVPVKILPLQQMNTEAQFTERVEDFLNTSGPKVLLIQAQLIQGDSGNLVDCARYVVQNKTRDKMAETQYSKLTDNTCIAFVLQVPRIRGGSFIGLPGHPWQSFHVDELKGDPNKLDLKAIRGRTLHEILTRKFVNVDKLIIDAIPKAVSITQTQRVKSRLEILLKIANDDQEFIDAIKIILNHSIKKDNEAVPLPEKWMVKMAIGSQYIQEGNTFAKSIWLHLVEKVAHSLAGIITTLDHENGLEHVKNKPESWQHQSFKNFVKSKEILEILKTKQHVDYAGRFPFSWCVIDHIDQIQDMETEASVLDVINEYQYVADIVHELIKDRDILREFLMDLIYSKVPSIGNLSQENQKTIRDHVEKRATVIKDERLNNDYEAAKKFNFVTVVDAYQAVKDLKNKIKNVVDLFSLKQDLDLKQVIQEDLDLDGIIMVQVLDKMKPEKSMNDLQFKDWLKLIRQIKMIKSNIDPNKIIHDKWMRLAIVSLYLETVWTNEKLNDPKTRQMIMEKSHLMWMRLKSDNEFIQLPDTFTKVLNVIIKTSDTAAEEILSLKNAEKCILCKDDFDYPIVLPCGHVGCLECLETFKENNKNCPGKGCKNIELPHDLRKCPADKKALLKHSQFREGLNKFFLRFLENFVFNTTQLPHGKIIEQLLEFIVHKKIKDETIKKKSTKRLSPFEVDKIDSTPVIRSFVLQLILRADFEKAQDHLEEFFHNHAQYDESNHVDLCILMIYCFEDQILTQKRGDVPLPEAFKWICECNTNMNKDLSIQTLLTMTKLRLGLQSIGKRLVMCLNTADGINVEQWCNEVRISLDQEKTESLKKYLVRTVIKLSRPEIIQVWKRDENLRQLLPQDILNSAPDNVHDFYLFLEDFKEPYKQIRDGLRNDLMKGKVEKIPGLLRDYGFERKNECWKMAIYFLTTMTKCAIKDKVLEDISKINNDLKKCIQAGVESARSDEVKPPNPMDEAVLSLVWQLDISLRSSKNNRWTDFFSQLSKGQNLKLLPTMPHDEASEARGAVKDATKWFTCQKGHSYAIGDCGQPRQLGKCPCGAKIGGTDYAFADTGLNIQQQQQADTTDKTRYGYILGPSDLMEKEKLIGIREINSLEVIILRFILHASIYLGTLNKTTEPKIKQLISCQPANVQKFLMDHMKLNMRQLGKTLNRNEEYAQLILHKTLLQMTIKHEGLKNNNEWAEKKSLMAFETDFSKKLIRPLVVNLDQDMESLRKRFNEDVEGAKSATILVLEEEDEKVKMNTPWQPLFWHPRQIMINAQSLEQILGGDDQLKKKCPKLLRLIKAENQLKMVQSLPWIIELHRFVKCYFDYSLDEHEVAKLNVDEFVKMHWPKQFLKEWKERINQYLEILNQWKHYIFENVSGNWGNLAKNALGDTQIIDRYINCRILFPNPNGLGCLAIGLVQLLIDYHNQIFGGRKHSIRVQDLVSQPDQLVKFDFEDVRLLILANSTYELEVGKGQLTKWSLDEKSLENMVLERYFSDTPSIDEKNQIRVHYQNELQKTKDLDNKIRQEKLPNTITKSLEKEFTSARDIGYVISKLEIMRDLLAEVGHQNPNESLMDCMIKFKLIRGVGQKSLKQIELTYLESLIKNLSFIKSKLLIQMREDPFLNSINSDLKVEITPKMSKLVLLHRKLPDLRQKTSQILFVLHTVIVEKLGKLDENSIDMKLRDFLPFVLDEAEEGHQELIEEFMNSFTEDPVTPLKCCHLVSMFMFLVLNYLKSES